MLALPDGGILAGTSKPKGSSLYSAALKNCKSMTKGGVALWVTVKSIGFGNCLRKCLTSLSVATYVSGKTYGGQSYG